MELPNPDTNYCEKSQNSHLRNTRLVFLTTCPGNAKREESYLMLAMVRMRSKSPNSCFWNKRLISLIVCSGSVNKGESYLMLAKVIDDGEGKQPKSPKFYFRNKRLVSLTACPEVRREERAT
jgi:hypothetical protein